ncbi:MAG: hypothetical protein ABIG96_02165 [Candidatus Micrarchaeota archaeon]
MDFRGLISLIALLLLTQGISADSLFMKCPTVFNTDASNITVNMYYGSPPMANCGDLGSADRQCTSTAAAYRLNVTINGDQTDLLNCFCNPTSNPGNWLIQVSTQLNQDYNISVFIQDAAGAVTAASSCMVPRKPFNAPFTIPEFSPLLIPLIIFAAISIIRKRR